MGGGVSTGYGNNDPISERGMEKVWKWATKMIKLLEYLPCDERLKSLKLFGRIKEQRNIVIENYKMCGLCVTLMGCEYPQNWYRETCRTKLKMIFQRLLHPLGAMGGIMHGSV